MHVTKSSLLILSLGCMLAGGCEKNNPDTNTPEPASTTPPPADPTPEMDPATEPATDTPAVDPNAAPPEPAAAEPPKLNDAEIAAVVKAANDSEIEHGKLAKTKAKDKKVKDFANMMVKHHTDMNKSGDKVVKKAGLEPTDSELSTKLTADARAKTDALNAAAKGAEFDRAYIDAQVEAHTAVLDAIDTRLLPAVQDPGLKAELEKARPKVEEHLQKAKEIQASLAAPAA